MGKQGTEAEQLTEAAELNGPAVSYSEGLIKEELRRVYSRLFTLPSETTGAANLKQVCTLIAGGGGQQQQQQQQPQTPRERVNGLLSTLHGGALPTGITPARELSDPQWECLTEAFSGNNRYAVLRHVQLPTQRASSASTTVKPEQLAVIYHALLGQEFDQGAADRLHAMKKDARSKQLSREEKQERLKTHLREVYTASSKKTDLEVDNVLADAMIAMLNDDKYVVLEPYEGGGTCVFKGQKLICY